MNKKIVALIVLLLLIIPSFKTYALEDSFYEGEYISGEYIKKFRNGSGKYEQLRFFRRKSDNQVVYCIELWEVLSSNKTLSGYDYDQYNYANIDYSIWERIMLISYYGYGYENHTDNKWYAVTQYMIWKETSPDTNIYFTDALNGNKIDKYQQEMDEINSLIQNHGDIPSFYNQTYQVKYKTPTTIYDANNVLEKFEIIGNGGLEISKNENNLTFIKNNPGESQILFANNGKRFQTAPIVYVDSDGQDVLAPGNYYPIYMVVNVNLPSTSIVVNKLDFDTKSNTAQGEAKFIGTKIQLLDVDNQLIAEQTIKENSTLTFENIGYGTYYIKEVEAGTGYLLNSEIITLEADNNTEIVNFYNQVITNEIVLQKYLKNTITGDTQKEKGARFSIYNNKNEQVETVTTDDNGIAKIVLPYGTYIVKQESGAKNHSYIKDFEIKVIENDIIQTFELYNEEVISKIKIINIDDDSALSILEKGASFKIKDLTNNQYLLDEDGNTLVLTTNDLGSTEFVILSSGKYQIEQIESVDGYYVNSEVFYFEISDETIFKIDDNQEYYLEIEIPNKKQKGQIEIDKYTEFYWNNTLIKTEKETDFSISIYAKEDIYSKDGIKIYEKNEEVGQAILKDNNIITPLLVFGNYYIKNSIDNTIIEIALNQVETQRIKLLDKVYEYEEEVLQETNIVVPNTYTKESIFSNLNLLLIGIGLFIIRKERKNEDN